eukprot:3891958-Prymnesium_polylepis.1
MATRAPDVNGCGAPRSPGAATPEPQPLHGEPLTAQMLPDVTKLARYIAGGKSLLEEWQAREWWKGEGLRNMALAQFPRPPCWLTDASALKARYLPGCTADGCVCHGSLLAAVAVCELLGDACTGVTAVLPKGPFQTRSGRSLQRGPREETSWVKRSCAPRLSREALDFDEDDDADD